MNPLALRSLIFRFSARLAALLLMGSLAGAADAPASKRIYLGLDDHTDYMWTADEAYYRRAFVEMIDFYQAEVDRTAKRPKNEQSRWNCDGSLWMWAYEKGKSPAEFEHFIARVRSGHMSVPLTALVSCYGGMPVEAILRSMYYAGTVERRHDIRFPLAIAMENQTLPYGLGALFAGSGAKYSWRGICDCATPLQGHFSDREHPLYWWTGPDGSRILMKWYPLLGKNPKALGYYSEVRHPFEAVREAESKAFTSRYPYNIVGLFGVGWDDPKTFNQEFSTLAKQMSTKDREVITSNEVDFFEDVEKTYGDRLPSQSVAFGNDWDLHTATLAEDTARVKRAVEKLRAAEALATLVSLQTPGFMADSAAAAAREQTWLNLGFYYEHNWIANGNVKPPERIAWQRRVADQIETFVDRLHTDASQALGKLIRGGGNPAHARFFVFNPLGWPRTDFADLPLAEDGPVHVIDLETGKETPSQVVASGGARRLRILAANVPSIGYKVFEVRPGNGATFPPAASVRDGFLENDLYRVTVAPRGAITSLIDKPSGRERVQPIDGRAVNDLGPGEGTLEIENSGPVSVTLRAFSPAPLKHTSRITLYRDSRRIDLHNEIQQNFNDPQTWSFAFKVDAPDIWHEEVGAVIRAKLLGDGGHYSTRNARYDWLTLNHYVDVSSQRGSGGVTLSSADCSFVRLGKSTMKELDASSAQLSVLAGGNVSGTDLKITGQGGAAYFLQRFAVQTHGAFEPAAAMRFSLEHQNPLVAGRVAGGTTRSEAYPEKAYSLLQVSRPDIFVWSVKPSEEGIERGLMARVWNMAHGPVQGEMTCAQPISGAKQTTHIETDLADVALVNGNVPLALAPQQIKTFRLMLPQRK